MIVINARNIEVGFMGIDDFLNLEPYSKTRLVEKRALKMSKIMNQRFLDTHLEVTLVKFPSREPRENETPFTAGEIRILNGNTRHYMWTMGLVENPSQVMYKVLLLDENDPNEHARKLYLSIDSKYSYDTNPELITGMYRHLNLEFQNDFIGEGRLGVQLRWAAYQNPHFPGKSNDDPDETVPYFADALLELDRIGLTPKTRHQASLVAFFLMLIKKYQGTDVFMKVEETINRIKLGMLGIEPTTTQGTDGISHIILEYLTHNRFEASKSGRKKSTNDDMRKQMKFLIFCWNKFLTGQRFKAYRASTRSQNREFWINIGQ